MHGISVVIQNGNFLRDSLLLNFIKYRMRAIDDS